MSPSVRGRVREGSGAQFEDSEGRIDGEEHGDGEDERHDWNEHRVVKTL